MEKERPTSAEAGATPSEKTENPVISMEDAQVSQAYVDWLNLTLPKFYKIQGKNSAEPNGPLTDEEVTLNSKYT